MKRQIEASIRSNEKLISESKAVIKRHTRVIDKVRTSTAKLKEREKHLNNLLK